MIYRPFGSTGLQVSALSMGCGHLPDDEDDCDQLLRAAVEAGVNYFETAQIYCNGLCQEKTGHGLEPVRDRVMVSAKHGLLVEDEAEGHPATTGDAYRREILEGQFVRLRVNRVEWLQVGWFQAYKIPALVAPGGVWEAIEQLRGEGLVDHVGCTTHDTPENVVEIIKSGLFESVTLQYNLLNRSYECALDAAGEHGVGIVVMGPLHGGMLGRPEPALVSLVGDPDLTTVRLGLQFVLEHPAVSTACSGMHSLAQLEENLAAVMAAPQAGDAEQRRAVYAKFGEVAASLCTACNYCAPCPQGVDISRNLRLRNYLAVWGAIDPARAAFAEIPADQRADRCNECGECEEKCPNGLPVRELLAEIAAALG